jgi:hypothetical protein
MELVEGETIEERIQRKGPIECPIAPPGKLPYRVKPNTTNGQRMVNDAATLSNYNSGLLTSGCRG